MQVHEQLRTGTGQPSDVSMCIGHDDVTKISPQIPTPSESLIGSPGSHLGETRAQTCSSQASSLLPWLPGFTVASENDTHVL